MKLTVGFSPCPNDTFIFDALINGELDTNELVFEPVMEDVQTLNEWAIEGRLDVTKISFGVLAQVLQHYQVIGSGSAMGIGVGPLLIGKNNFPQTPINSCTIAIPGENTTAHLLFAMAYPEATDKIFMRYDKIEDFLLKGDGIHQAGVIIHENRFTYRDKGLHLLMDLGNFWEEKMNTPVPLGGIVVRRSIDVQVQLAIEQHIRNSIYLSRHRYPELSLFIKQHAQEMSEEVMRKHIDLYVNDYSSFLGSGGEGAILKLLNINQKLRSKREVSAGEVFLSA